ncbi:MAG: ZIP family metal transporter [Candidatus Aenigmarchaeota archaeon]|nr:ZIP family metal transporter [Candidatus Aenigmarchaeota archaeon]
MADTILYAFSSVLLVSLVSLVGVITLSIKPKVLKNILLYLVSFAAGALFGDAFIHLLPEVVEQSGFSLYVSLYVLAGIVVFFSLEKLVQWHHYHLPHSKQQAHPFSVMVLVGDAVHNFIDGLIIGASYLVSIPVGIATTIAVILHEIPQEIGDFGVLLHGGFSRGKALLFNFLTALTAVLGVGVSLYLSSYVENVTMMLIPFAVGGFIYIAGSDLIPELHKQSSPVHSVLQLLAFLLGVGVMVALLWIG